MNEAPFIHQEQIRGEEAVAHELEGAQKSLAALNEDIETLQEKIQATENEEEQVRYFGELSRKNASLLDARERVTTLSKELENFKHGKVLESAVVLPEQNQELSWGKDQYVRLMRGLSDEGLRKELEEKSNAMKIATALGSVEEVELIGEKIKVVEEELRARTMVDMRRSA